MRLLFYIVFSLVLIGGFMSCKTETDVKDRTEAHELFENIVSLTKRYSGMVSEAKDSAEWEKHCTAFEDSLDKINFKFPPDTDLLLSEGQNDTIMTMMKAYIEARDSRINEILHPSLPNDTIPSDSMSATMASSMMD